MIKKLQKDGSKFPEVIYVDSDIKDEGVIYAQTTPFEGELGEYHFVKMRNFKTKFVEED